MEAPALSPHEAVAWHGFLQAHAMVVRRLEAALLTRHNLPLNGMQVLARLVGSKGGEVRMSDLATAVALSPSGLTRLADRLEAEGLIKRQTSSADGRAVHVVITDQGRVRLEESHRTHTVELRRLFLDHFTAADLDQLGSLWRRLNLPSDPVFLSELAQQAEPAIG
ncbi:MAG: MarR family winged helix-turn-helix transcriptional regulator [Candidatus Dormibacteria bacterium]